MSRRERVEGIVSKDERQTGGPESLSIGSQHLDDAVQLWSLYYRKDMDPLQAAGTKKKD